MKTLVFVALVLCLESGVLSRPPIVLVPGIGGSQIEAYLDRKEILHYWCEKKSSSWFTLWLSIEELLPLAVECWTDNMKLVFDPDSGTMVNTPGVKTRVPGFGNTTSIAYLDPSLSHPGEYFYPLVDFLVKNLGYKRGGDLRAAPYDFRFSPDNSGDYFDRLRALIEEAYAANGNRRVLLFSHSMGGPYSLHFLHRQTQKWKDKHIELWVTAGAVWGGAVKSMRAYASGDPFGVPSAVDRPIVMRPAQRTYTSLAFISPSHHFWGEDEPLVVTPKRNYTVADFEQFFNDLGYPLANKIKQMVSHLWTPEPPRVPLYSMYGTNMPTPGVLHYGEGQFPDHQPAVKSDNGDGTVNLRSLEGGLRWRHLQKESVVGHALPGAEHLAMLGDERLLATMKRIVDKISQ